MPGLAGWKTGDTFIVDLIMPLCYVPLSQHNRPFCLKSSQKCPVVCLCRCTICLWWSFAFYFDILPPSGALALSPVPTLLSLSQLLTDIGVGVNNGVQLFVLNLMGMFTCE